MHQDAASLPSIALTSIFRAYFPFLVATTPASPDPHDIEGETPRASRDGE